MNQSKNVKIHQFFIISALCILPIDCTNADVNGCQAEASATCSQLAIGSKQHKACIEFRISQCFSNLCHDRSVTFCNSDSSCMANYKSRCAKKLKAFYLQTISCESKTLTQCQSQLLKGLNLENYAKCWETMMKSCFIVPTAHRIAYLDCEDIVEQEQLCFDIEGSQQCTNVSYTVMVCYY